jgi:hypothetical protein
MRKLPAALSALVVAAALTQGLASLASSPFSGSLRAQIGLEIPAGAIQTTSNVTFVDFAMAYKIGDVTFSSLMSFDATGMAVLEFRGRGALNPVEFDSRLTFSPVLGGVGSTLDLNQSLINPSHLYDFGRIYFVDQIEVTSLTLEDNLNTTWRVRVSKDGTDGSWVWVSDEITGNTSIPVVLPIGEYVRYAQIVGITGYISDSVISVQVSSEAFVTDIDIDAFGISLEAEVAYASGGSEFWISLGPAESGGVFDSATLHFGLDPVTCVTCFETLEIELDLPFACLDKGSVDIGFDFDEGFSGLTLDTQGIPTGLSWLSVDLGIDLSIAEKDVDLWPSLELEEYACVTPYFKIDFGTEVWDLEGLTLYGLRLRYNVNGVTVESLSYLDDIHHTKEDYWEKFRVSVDGDTCCGGGFNFDTSTHFSKNHTTLFDWAETEIALELDVGYNVTFGGYAAFIPSGLSDLIFRVRVTW